VRRNCLPLRAAIFGLGLLCATQLPAQTTGSGSSSSGGVVNMPKEVPPQSANSGGTSGQIQLKDLLSYKIQAADGAFGRVSDVVFDRSGNIQYLLGSYQGQTFPLPFMPSAFGATGNTLSYDVPIAQLQQLAINAQQLPSLNNQAFIERMRQVFGDSFGATSGQQNAGTGGSQGNGIQPGRFQSTNGVVRGVGPTTPGTGRFESTNGLVRGVGDRSAATDVAGGAVAGGGAKIGSDPSTSSGATGTTSSGTTSSGSSGTSMSQDTWAWPNGSTTSSGGSGSANRFPAPDPRTGRTDIRPNPFTKSRSGNTDNSGVGTGGRTLNPPPNGNATGQTGTKSKTGSGSTTGTNSQSGSGTSTGGATGSGSGASGSGSSGGSGS